MNLQRAEMLMSDLMKYYGLTDWTFTFDRSLTRLGYCQHKIKAISLGKHATLVNSEVEVLNTAMHEIAHALVGSRHGHDAIWKAKTKEIGCTGERLGHIAVKAPHKYQMYCTDCNYIWKYYRKPTLGPCYIHKCSALLTRIGYTPDKPWVPVSSNLKVEALV
jgi:hypothetical protein